MQGHGRIIAHDFCIAHREANSGLSTLNRTKSILSIYHQQRQLQKQRGMCLNDTYPFCQQPLSDNCHSICFSKPVLWTATPPASLFYCKNLYCKEFVGADSPDDPFYRTPCNAFVGATLAVARPWHLLLHFRRGGRLCPPAWACTAPLVNGVIAKPVRTLVVAIRVPHTPFDSI